VLTDEEEADLIEVQESLMERGDRQAAEIVKHATGRLKRAEERLHVIELACTYANLMDPTTRTPRIHLRGDEILALLMED
jgi:hypothetical protein